MMPSVSSVLSSKGLPEPSVTAKSGSAELLYDIVMQGPSRYSLPDPMYQLLEPLKSIW